MCDLKPIKALSAVPGQVLYSDQAAQPRKPKAAPTREAIAVLEQMFGYYAA